MPIIAKKKTILYLLELVRGDREFFASWESLTKFFEPYEINQFWLTRSCTVLIWIRLSVQKFVFLANSKYFQITMAWKQTCSVFSLLDTKETILSHYKLILVESCAPTTQGGHVTTHKKCE